MTAMSVMIAAPAHAQSEPGGVDFFSREAFRGLIDVRAALSDGEPSWVDGGFGKTRYGGDSGRNFQPDLHMANAILEWRPRLGWSLSGVVDLEVQSDPETTIDFTEAYLQYKPLLPGGTKVSARAGLFYPPVSLEHDGPAWTTTRTITPSAINSWIGEEVKALGGEVGVKREFAGHELGLTLGGYGSNDTAGTLLSFRGWSLNDVRATAFGDYPLPALNSFIRTRQYPSTTPTLELDDRLGYYVRADWRPPAPFAINAIYYDNLGDMESRNVFREWSWLTRFYNIGGVWTPRESTEVLAQAMWGETLMGFPRPVQRWVEVNYSSAYLLVSQRYGASAVTGRIEAFETENRSALNLGNYNEEGWALTTALRHDFTDGFQLMFEALHVDSNRPSRGLARLPADQKTTTLQASARFWF